MPVGRSADAARNKPGERSSRSFMTMFSCRSDRGSRASEIAHQKPPFEQPQPFEQIGISLPLRLCLAKHAKAIHRSARPGQRHCFLGGGEVHPLDAARNLGQCASVMAKVLLIVGGGIAAYKSLELVRLLKKAGHKVTPVLTKGGEQIGRAH